MCTSCRKSLSMDTVEPLALIHDLGKGACGGKGKAGRLDL